MSADRDAGAPAPLPRSCTCTTHPKTCTCAAATARRLRSYDPVRDEFGRVLWRCRCGAEGASEILHPQWWRLIESDGRARVVLCVGCYCGQTGAACERAHP